MAFAGNSTRTASRVRRWGGLALGTAALGALAWAARGVPTAMGAALPGRGPTGTRAERMRRSPAYDATAGRFRNQAPTTMPGGQQIVRFLGAAVRGGGARQPRQPIPVVAAPPALVGRAAPSAAGGLHVTWYGHASTLVELDGRRVLIDPVWSDRCSPSAQLGPRRLHPAPVALDELPRVDAVVISHDHYDHLDVATVRHLARAGSAPFLVPLGVGAHLERWGVAPDRIIELDWDESATVAGVRFVLTAAQHFSGRGFTRDTTLWGSWVLAGPTRRVFYTGDTGYFDGFARTGAEHGPFDAALVQVGAYSDAWPDIHMTPEEGIQTGLDLRAGLVIPVHWCSYVLALHSWAEPADRAWREAKARSVALAVPRPGERVDVDDPPDVDGWWQLIA